MISQPTFRKKFNPLYKNHLQKQIRRALGSAPIGPVGKILRRDGKRIRPYLIFLSYELCGGRGHNKDIQKLAIAIEQLHTYAKLQDDFLDRNGLENKPIYNLSTDLALIFAHETFFQISCADTFKQYWFQMQEDTWRGEYREFSEAILHTEKDIINQEKEKTAFYTFSYPLLFGALLANNKKVASKMFAIGGKIGLAYQLKNDLDSFLEKNGGEDIQNRRMNLLHHFAIQNDPGLAKYFGRKKKNLTIPEAKSIQKRISRGVALSQVQAVIIGILKEVERDIMKAPLSEKGKLQFASLLASLFSRRNGIRNHSS